MNTCIVCLGEENNNNLIEYNHCGVYHIHKSCLNRWQKDECIICREKIESIPNESNNTCRMCIVISTLCTTLSALVCTLLIISI